MGDIVDESALFDIRRDFEAHIMVDEIPLKLYPNHNASSYFVLARPGTPYGFRVINNLPVLIRCHPCIDGVISSSKYTVPRNAIRDLRDLQDGDDHFQLHFAEPKRSELVIYITLPKS